MIAAKRNVVGILLASMIRTRHTQLPARAELALILDAEARRALPAGKQTTHYPEFETVINLLNYYGLKADIFTDDSLGIHQIVSSGAALVDTVVERLAQKNHADTQHTMLLTKMYQYLSAEDTPKKSDIIFVFGAGSLARAQKALELFESGLSSRIVLSGGKPFYAKQQTAAEAVLYKDYLLQHGVPESAIITEEESITVADNVCRSLNLLDELGIAFSRVITVASPYSQRRCWAVLNKHLPDTVRLYRANAQTEQRYDANHWCRQEETFRVVLNEFVKMRASVAYNTA